VDLSNQLPERARSELAAFSCLSARATAGTTSSSFGSNFPPITIALYVTKPAHAAHPSTSPNQVTFSKLFKLNKLTVTYDMRVGESMGAGKFPSGQGGHVLTLEIVWVGMVFHYL